MCRYVQVCVCVECRLEVVFCSQWKYLNQKQLDQNFELHDNSWETSSANDCELILYLGRQTHLPPTPPTGRSNSDVQTWALGFRLSSEFGLKHSWT